MERLPQTTRSLVSRAITNSRKGWKAVADELSHRVGEIITEPMLHEFTRSPRSDGKATKVLPMAWVAVLAEITGSHELEQYALCDECRRALAIGKIGLEAMSQKGR